MLANVLTGGSPEFKLTERQLIITYANGRQRGFNYGRCIISRAGDRVLAPIRLTTHFQLG